MLHPAGYHRDRPRPALVKALRSRYPTECSARLQNMEDISRFLDRYFVSAKEDPSDNRYLYGYEDANWRLWSLIDPRGHAAAFKCLPL